MSNNQSIPYRHFTPSMTREAIRDQYRNLAKILHPDLGGNTADMQELNAEYEMAMDCATRQEMPGRTEGSYTHQAETNERIRQAIEAALRFDHLTVELIGWWVWVHGTVKGDAAIPTLKEAGYKWAAKKSAWFFPGIPSQNRRKLTMDEVREMHSSKTIRRNDRRDSHNDESQAQRYELS